MNTAFFILAALSIIYYVGFIASIICYLYWVKIIRKEKIHYGRMLDLAVQSWYVVYIFFKSLRQLRNQK